jgi:hypothetical protein
MEILFNTGQPHCIGKNAKIYSIHSTCDRFVKSCRLVTYTKWPLLSLVPFKGQKPKVLGPSKSLDFVPGPCLESLKWPHFLVVSYMPPPQNVDFIMSRQIYSTGTFIVIPFQKGQILNDYSSSGSKQTKKFPVPGRQKSSGSD